MFCRSIPLSSVLKPIRDLKIKWKKEQYNINANFCPYPWPVERNWMTRSLQGIILKSKLLLITQGAKHIVDNFFFLSSVTHIFCKFCYLLWSESHRRPVLILFSLAHFRLNGWRKMIVFLLFRPTNWQVYQFNSNQWYRLRFCLWTKWIKINAANWSLDLIIKKEIHLIFF